MKPTIALFTGDPAGIGPELVAGLLTRSDAAARANIVLITHRSGIRGGLETLGASLELSTVDPRDLNGNDLQAPVLAAWPGIDADDFERAVADARNGRFMLDALAFGIDLCQRGLADALCFAPLNKSALRAGGMTQADEMHWFADLLDHRGTCAEFNVLDTLWTSRVTSHVPLSAVSGLLSREKVAQAIELITRALKNAGVGEPRIAVCGLNPHNGDNGSFGREEIDIIGPGVELARERGFPADGPFPADTAFVRAIRQGPGNGYHGVVTMYHDQGQIAMKLMGFERGVTVQGGLPIVITTPAHGTAYDIAGRGIANRGAMDNAFALACRMGEVRRSGRTDSAQVSTESVHA